MGLSWDYFTKSSGHPLAKGGTGREPLTPSGARLTVTTYTAQLSGANEASPVDTRARGAAILQLNADGTELKYRLIASNIDDVTMAHIHVGAVGQNGPFVAWLYGPTSDGGAQNGVLATGTITADDLVGPLAGQTLEDLVALIESGDAYVNVHTAAYPGGEIRGQVR